MDKPIFIRMMNWLASGMLFWDVFYVIEERGSAVEASAADECDSTAADECDSEHNSSNDRVRVLDLRGYHYRVESAGFAVAKSRLFLVGGNYTSEERRRPSGILSIDLQRSDPSWCEIPMGTVADITSAEVNALDFAYVRGAVVSDDGEWIDVMGTAGKILRLHVNQDGSLSIRCCLVPQRKSILLARTETKLFMHCPKFYSAPVPSGELGYFNFESNSWVEIHSRVPWCSRSKTAVVVRDLYLISFAVWSPLTADFGPALYVYDIGRREWLPEPVQGLKNDGNILPSVDDDPVSDAFLMQVRRDELKLAAVWSAELEPSNSSVIETVVHCVKFILRIKENGENQGTAPTFFAESVSSAIFNAGTTCISMQGTTGE